MKRIIAIAAILTAPTLPALALDNADFQSAALKCWNQPASSNIKSPFVMSVEIDGRGELLDITAKEYEKSAQHRVIGESLKRAIMRCAPYKFPTGVYTITINGKTLDGKSISIWKD